MTIARTRSSNANGSNRFAALPGEVGSAGMTLPLFYVGHRRGARVNTNAFVQELSQAGVQADAIRASDRDHEGINALIGTVGEPYTVHVDEFLRTQRAAPRTR